jgi:hypothetical protein
MLKVAAILVVYLALAGTVLWCWLRWTHGESLGAMVLCFVPMLVGLALMFTSQADAEQYVLRLTAAVLMLPLLLGMWVFSQDVGAPPAPYWPYPAGAAVLHVLGFLGLLLWLAPATTRVSAAAVSPVSLDALQARIYSLNDIGGPIDVGRGADGEMVMRFRFAANDRSHRVLLTFDSEAKSVRVRERKSESGAKPVTESERSLRGVGEPYWDPTRPEATSVMSRSALISPIKAEQLAAMPVVLQGRSVSVPREVAGKIDTDSMVVLVCKVVTESGWNWAPVFFGD